MFDKSLSEERWQKAREELRERERVRALLDIAQGRHARLLKVAQALVNCGYRTYKGPFLNAPEIGPDPR
jgi:hypothetical protein